jgi:negative regulator of sigma E activity
VPCPLHRRRQLALVAKAIARNPARHDPTALGEKIPQEPDVLEINGPFFDAKPAWAAPLKKSPSAAAITPSTTPGTFPFHNLPHSYCGSSYS